MSHGKLYTVLFMVTLSIIFGAAIAGLSIISKPVIEKNNQLVTQRAYVAVFGLGNVDELSDEAVLALVRDFVDISDKKIEDPETGMQFQVLRAYEDKAHQTLKALAFNFRGLGFWAPIEGLMALTPDRSRTIGIVITSQKETPGLGGRVEEPIFTEPFKAGILVAPPEDAGKKCILISSTRPPEGTELAERHVEAITGATQTCMAMDTVLNDALRAFGRAWENTENAENMKF